MGAHAPDSTQPEVRRGGAWKLLVGASAAIALGAGAATMVTAEGESVTSVDVCADIKDGDLRVAPPQGCDLKKESLITISGEQGPVGPDGPVGPEGPQGEPGGLRSDDLLLVVEEYEVEETDQGTTISLEASCPEGYFAIGGGGDQSNSQFEIRGFGLQWFFTNSQQEYRVGWRIPGGSWVEGRGDRIRTIANCYPDS
jgi:hypothetical protein